MYEQKVIEVLKKVRTEDTEITMETALVEDLGFDSLEVIGIITEFEDEYGIEIPEKVIPSLRTAGDIARYLEEHVE